MLELNHPSFPWLAERTVFLTKHGSHAYGTATSQSDEDYRGFAIAPLKNYFGFNNFEQAEFKGNPDIVIYDIRKFFRLAMGANPNIFETIFCESKDVVSDTNSFIYTWIIQNRHLFLSKLVARTYLGYMTQIMQRIAKNKDSIDFKDGMHLVRLGRMGVEILQSGTVLVKRPDAEELLAIRNGAWDYYQFAGFAVEIECRTKELREKSTLPNEPNRAFIEKEMIALINNFIYTENNEH